VHIEEEKNIRKMLRQQNLCKNWAFSEDKTNLEGVEVSKELEHLETTAQRNRNLKIDHLCNENLGTPLDYPSATEETRKLKEIRKLNNKREASAYINNLCSKVDNENVKKEWLTMATDVKSLSSLKELATKLQEYISKQ
jgi:hypothetical protein